MTAIFLIAKTTVDLEYFWCKYNRINHQYNHIQNVNVIINCRVECTLQLSTKYLLSTSSWKPQITWLRRFAKSHASKPCTSKLYVDFVHIKYFSVVLFCKYCIFECMDV